MKKINILLLYLVLLLPIKLFSYGEVSALNEVGIKHYNWDIGFTSNYFYEPNLFNDNSTIQGFSHNFKGYYFINEKIVVGGSFFFSETYKSDLVDKWLTVVGDISLEGGYVFYNTTNLELFAKGGIYLFSPVEGESTYGDTSSYKLNLSATYSVGQFLFNGDVGYFYDRRINLTKFSPSDFERLSWNDVGYISSPVKINAIFDSGRSEFLLGLSSTLLYTDNGTKLYPLYSNIRVIFDLTENLYLKGGLAVKLYNDNIDFYPYLPKFRYMLSVFYHPIGKEEQIPENLNKISEIANKGSVHVVIKDNKGDFVTNPVLDFEGYSSVPKVLKEGEIIFNLMPGNYKLNISATGYKSAVTGFSLTAAENKSVEIILKKIEVLGGIAGLVTAEYKPLNNVSVVLHNYPEFATKTDDSGMFKIQNIVAGTYEVTFSNNLYKPVTTYIEVLPNKTVVLNQALEMKQFKHGVINLKVINKDGKSIDNCKIKVNSKLNKVEYNENGEVRIITTPGKIVVTIEADGYKVRNKKFYIDVNDELDYTFKLYKSR